MKRPSGFVTQAPRADKPAAPAEAQKTAQPRPGTSGKAGPSSKSGTPSRRADSASAADSASVSSKPKGAAGRTRAERSVRDAATAATATRFGVWRETRRAIGDRRKVERGEMRRFTRRQRVRRRSYLIGSGVVVAVLLSAVLIAFSPFMSLKHIDVVGTSRIKTSEVQQALKGQLGRPLPLVSMADIRHDLDDFRLIRSYSTELHPPSTLVVRIDERVPLAVVKVGASYELVDQAGVVISSTAAPPKGYALVDLAAGESDPQTSPSFASAAAVLAALPSAVRAQVGSVAASSANSVTLTLTSGKTVVWGGTSQAALKQADLNALLIGAPGASVYDVSSPESPVTR